MWEDPAYCEWCHHLWAGGPGCIENQNEQAMKNQPVSSRPPWPLQQLLPPGSSLMFLPITSLDDDELQAVRRN